ncbi:MAG: hypothetical protein GXY47_14880 [Acidobacteria bacterium]|nr:hypothetical protein [Acidobacteriota bacterium]
MVPFVSPGDIERLKSEVSVERLAEARGIRLERHGADLIGLCPFHEDRNPSLVISPGKNLWQYLNQEIRSCHWFSNSKHKTATGGIFRLGPGISIRMAGGNGTIRFPGRRHDRCDRGRHHRIGIRGPSHQDQGFPPIRPRLPVHR